jgi:RNA polymerase sigma factor (sigma-70 family)
MALTLRGAPVPRIEHSDTEGRSNETESLGTSPWTDDPIEVFRIVYPSLVALAHATAQREQAENLAQEALVRVLARHPDFTGIEHHLGYSKTVLLRLVYRRLGRRSVTEVPAGLQERLEGLPQPSPEQQVIDRETLFASLQRLGRGQRACVYLRYVQGLTDDETAVLLGCRTVTVRSQIARGLRNMRSSLKEIDHP